MPYKKEEEHVIKIEKKETDLDEQKEILNLLRFGTNAKDWAPKFELLDDLGIQKWNKMYERKLKRNKQKKVN